MERRGYKCSIVGSCLLFQPRASPVPRVSQLQSPESGDIRCESSRTNSEFCLDVRCFLLKSIELEDSIS